MKILVKLHSKNKPVQWLMSMSRFCYIIKKLFCYLIRKQKPFFTDQMNSKRNVPVLFLNDMDWNFKTMGQRFQACKNHQKWLWLVLLDGICLVSFSQLWSAAAFCLWIKALKNDLSTELTFKTTISLWNSHFHCR